MQQESPIKNLKSSDLKLDAEIAREHEGTGRLILSGMLSEVLVHVNDLWNVCEDEEFLCIAYNIIVDILLTEI